MRFLLVSLSALLAGCATLGGQPTLTPQGEAAILALIQIATGVAAGTVPVQGGINSACAQLATITPMGSCTATNDPAKDLQNCLLYSVEVAALARATSKVCTPTK